MIRKNKLLSGITWLFATVLIFSVAGSFAAEKPNIILIMADDIAYDNFGCYGSEYFKTPPLDKLAETGAKFNPKL